MKKQPVDPKKAAANDKENGSGKKVLKRTKVADDEKYTIGSIAPVKRGFLATKRRGKSLHTSPLVIQLHCRRSRGPSHTC